ncbi:MAG TPA: M15 family metallopeptidase [Fimbriimonadaceae bacterium]|nr:M15 family metallopeptidase [Fimbriimonadaceae bacterium]
MSLLDLVPTPPRSDMNTGLSPARHQTMIDVLGRPGELTKDCSEPTNQGLIALIETKDVGPFRVTGIKPALEDLAAIFAAVKKNNMELYNLLGTAGMLCVRAVRGSTTHFSNHSWGSAIDMTIGGLLAEMNATHIPSGLLALYPFFHEKGWFWAAGYNGRTDPMHFEVANETLLAWRDSGRLKP